MIKRSILLLLALCLGFLFFSSTTALAVDELWEEVFTLEDISKTSATLESIAVSKDGTVFISDQTHSVIIAKDKQNRTTVIGEGMLSYVSDIAYDDVNNHLYVLDSVASKIQVFDLNYELVFSFSDLYEIELDSPTGISLNATTIAITDNTGIIIGDRETEISQRIISTGDYMFEFTKDIVLMESGFAVCELTSSSTKIWIFDGLDWTDISPEDKNDIWAITTDNSGRVFGASMMSHDVMAYSEENGWFSWGEAGEDIGQLKEPGDVFFINGYVYVTDLGNNRIQRKLTESQITGFSINTGDDELMGTIDNDNHSISLPIPWGVSTKSLIPQISLTPGATIAPDSISHDFSDIIEFVVSKENEYDVNYTVTPNFLPKDENVITSLYINDVEANLIIDKNAFAIYMYLPYGVDLYNVPLGISLSEHSYSKPISGRKVDLSIDLAIDVSSGFSSKRWLVKTIVLPNTENNVLSADIVDYRIKHTLDDIQKEIVMYTPFGFDLSAVDLTLDLSENATVDIDLKDISLVNPFTFPVTSQSGDSVSWTIKAVTDSTTIPMLNSVIFTSRDKIISGVVDEENSIVEFDMPMLDHPLTQWDIDVVTLNDAIIEIDSFAMYDLIISRELSLSINGGVKRNYNIIINKGTLAINIIIYALLFLGLILIPYVLIVIVKRIQNRVDKKKNSKKPKGRRGRKAELLKSDDVVLEEDTDTEILENENDIDMIVENPSLDLDISSDDHEDDIIKVIFDEDAKNTPEQLEDVAVISPLYAETVINNDEVAIEENIDDTDLADEDKTNIINEKNTSFFKRIRDKFKGKTTKPDVEVIPIIKTEELIDDLKDSQNEPIVITTKETLDPVVEVDVLPTEEEITIKSVPTTGNADKIDERIMDLETAAKAVSPLFDNDYPPIIDTEAKQKEELAKKMEAEEKQKAKEELEKEKELKLKKEAIKKRRSRHAQEGRKKNSTDKRRRR